MIVLQLIQNLALIVLLAVIDQMIRRRWDSSHPIGMALSGALFGGIGVVAMMTPFVIGPGLFYDGRSIILSVAGFFGGPVVATVAGLICVAYRSALGGVGVYAGVFTIVEAAAVGVLFYYLRRRGLNVSSWAGLLLMGMIVHVLAVGAQLVFLPGGTGWPAVQRVGPSMLTLFPIGTVLVAQLLLDQEQRIETQERRAHDLERLRLALASVIDVTTNVVEIRDPYTAGHQRRVAQLSEAIAREMGLSESETTDIRVAGLIHDVGKISIPAEILCKPGRLTATEYELIKVHAEKGFQLIESAHMEGPVAELVYQHHERCDGTGYPRGLSEDEILGGAKILMVADVVEAMMSHRPYRPGLGLDEALAEIERGAGTAYDAVVSRTCVSVFREGGFCFADNEAIL